MTLRDYRTGRHNDPWRWEAMPDQIGAGEYRTERYQVAGRNGSLAPSSDTLEPRRITFDLIYTSVGPHDLVAEMDALAEAWAPVEGNELLELTINRDRWAERVLIGRPVGVMFDENLRFKAGLLRARCLWDAIDPYAYSAVEESIDLPSLSVTGFDAALPFDAQIPFNGGNPFATTIFGEVPVRGRFELTGPFSYFAVAVGPKAWALAGPVNAGQTIIVDTREQGPLGPRREGQPVSWSLLRPSSNVDMALPVGSSTIVVGARGTGTATFTYRPTWRMA